MAEGICPIWKTRAKLLQDHSYPQKLSFDGQTVFSNRAGGFYQIPRRVIVNIEHKPLTDTQKTVLTTWLVDQRSRGVECPIINEETVENLQNMKSLTLTEKVRRFYLYYNTNVDRMDQTLNVNIGANDDGEETGKLENLCAVLGLKTIYEVEHFFQFLKDMGFIIYNKVEQKLTAQGYQKLDEILSTNINSNQVFVAQWFGGKKHMDEMNKLFDEGIAKAVEDSGLGLKALRIDRKDHNDKICDEIIAEIRRSKLVVADFTCDSATPAPGEPTEAIVGGDIADDERIPLIRGGVYYEAGFAHGLGIPVIFTCRIDCTKAIHFDTQQYNHILWKDEADLTQKLKQRIRATFNPN
jgi:hypothetical protein